VTQLAVRVILLEPEKEGNIGAVARSMKNFDLDDLWIVNPKIAIGGEARAYAMGGRGILESAKIVGTFEEALGGIDAIVGTSSVTARSVSNLSRMSITVSQLAERIGRSKGVMGVVFGRESSGLNNQEVEKCDFMVTIPASRDYNVLNVATAASIVFYELFKRNAAPRMEPATSAAKERLMLHFDRLVKQSGVSEHRNRLARRAFRNVISRSFISTREASLLVGVFRKASSKLL
jgi:TrmH family RNA methyltransferase